MTANINIQNKTVMPEQLKPVLKAVDHQSNDIKPEQNTVRSINPTTEADKTENISTAEKIKETTEEKESSEQSLDSAVKQLNSYVQSINRNLEFNIDKDNGRTVVKVIDAETDELIRQIPNEEALEIAKNLDNDFSGEPKETELLLIRAKA